MHSAEWYATQPIPERLIADLARAPFVPEWQIARYMKARHHRPNLKSMTTLAHAANGLSVKLTALEMGMSNHTIAEQRQWLIYYFGSRNITHAVATGIAFGYLAQV